MGMMLPPRLPAATLQPTGPVTLLHPPPFISNMLPCTPIFLKYAASRRHGVGTWKQRKLFLIGMKMNILYYYNFFLWLPLLFSHESLLIESVASFNIPMLLWISIVSQAVWESQRGIHFIISNCVGTLCANEQRFVNRCVYQTMIPSDGLIIHPLETACGCRRCFEKNIINHYPLFFLLNSLVLTPQVSALTSQEAWSFVFLNFSWCDSNSLFLFLTAAPGTTVSCLVAVHIFHLLSSR